MAARAGMVALVNKVRKLIGNPSSSVISDDEIQEALDDERNRRNVVFAPLDCLCEIGSSGKVEYKRFTFGAAPWEGGNSSNLPKLQNGSGASIRSDLASENLWNGEFLFNSEQNNGVYITGQVYDLYGAAADLLELNEALASDEYDVTIHDKTFKRSQKGAKRQALITRYEAKRWAISVQYPSAGVVC